MEEKELKSITDYLMHMNTIAFLPGYHTIYNTTILEENQILHCRQSALEIIETACLSHWTTYEGRRNAVMEIMNYKYKVPIPLDFQKKLVIFPTHSPDHIHNHWIFAHKVKRFMENKNGTTIIFSNNYMIDVDVSLHTLKRQYKRAILCLMYGMNAYAQIGDTILVQQNKLPA